MRHSRDRGGGLPEYMEGKVPCWKIWGCSKYVYQKCPAFLYPERPCWENAYTKNEILLGIQRDCPSCKVFNLHHEA